MPPRREHGAVGDPGPAARRHRPARDRERRQPRLPGGVPRRGGRPGDGVVDRGGRGQAAQVPPDVPHLRPRARQQGRPARARRLRPRQVPVQPRGGPPGRRAAAGERAHRRGGRRVARVARARPGAPPGGRVRALDDPRTEANAAFCPCGAEWEFEPPTTDPFVRQELVETLYHVLWELVHVFFDHLAEGQGTGASSFLYPFLGKQDSNLDAVVGDVARSVVQKADEVRALREQTLLEGREELVAAAKALRTTFATGQCLFALGNGGSATDAMDVVADFRDRKSVV